MNISSLPLASGFYRRNIENCISPFIKTSLKRDVKLLMYNLREFMNDVESGIIRDKFIDFEKFGVVKLGKNLEEGVVFRGDEFDSKICISDDIFKLSLLSKSGKPGKIYEFNDDKIIEFTKLSRTDADIDEYLESILDLLSVKMSDLRSACTKNMPKPYIPTKLEQKKLDKINKAISITVPENSLIATISGRELDLCKEVLTQFKMVKEVYKKFNNPITRSNVKARYSNYDLANSNANTCAFQKGYMGNPFQISVSQVSGEDYIIIRTLLKDNSSHIFTINPKGQVQKNMPYEVKILSTGIRKRTATKPEFYSQEELKDKNLETLLVRASKELEKLAKHGEMNLKNHAKFAEEHINIGIGSTKHLSPLIDEIFASIEIFKQSVRNIFGNLPGRNDLRKEFNIDWSRRGIRINDATKEGKDLRLTFPFVLGKRATQLLVTDKDDKVYKTFFILDDKLVKFNVKNIGDEFSHPTRQQYYFSQRVIDNSRLKSYLKLIKSQLEMINKHLLQDIDKQGK